MNKFIFGCLALLNNMWFGSVSFAGQTHLLTGIIASSEHQLVTVPKTRNWRVQIQWIAEEGSIVKKGELVTVFDSGGLEASLEQDEEQLVTEQIELQQIEMKLEQAVIEAQGRLELANISVDKSLINASIPDGEISAYQKGKHVIAYEKALVEKIKAEENLKRKQQEQFVGIEKQKIQIIKLKEKIAYSQSQLMSVTANVTGPVSHMMHPNLDGKISAGINARVGWKILTIQAQSGYQVKSWIHELDAARIDLDNVDIRLSLDAYPGKTYGGEIIKVSSQAEQKTEWSNSAYYAVDISFSQTPDVTIYPGMSVRVILTPTNKQTVDKKVSPKGDHDA